MNNDNKISYLMVVVIILTIVWFAYNILPRYVCFKCMCFMPSCRCHQVEVAPMVEPSQVEPKKVQFDSNINLNYY